MARIIVAVSLNNVIGRADGTIPWAEREDLKNFRKLTSDPQYGQVLIVGRKTAETMPALGGGRMIMVATKHKPCDVTRMRCLPHAVGTLDELLTKYPNAWIAGGGEIYRAAMYDPRVTDAHVTHLHYEANGEVTFPMPEFFNLFAVASLAITLTSTSTVPGHLTVSHYVRRRL